MNAAECLNYINDKIKWNISILLSVEDVNGVWGLQRVCSDQNQPSHGNKITSHLILHPHTLKSNISPDITLCSGWFWIWQASTKSFTVLLLLLGNVSRWPVKCCENVSLVIIRDGKDVLRNTQLIRDVFTVAKLVNILYFNSRSFGFF